jgi:hypothetical protein
MRLIYLLVVFSVLCIQTTKTKEYFDSYLSNFNENNSDSMFISRENLLDFKVETEVLDTSVSSVDDDFYAFNVKLKVKVVNKASTPLLIYRNWFSTSHIWISKDLEKLSNKKFEASISLSNYSDLSMSFQNIEIKDFVVLKNEDVFETEESVGILLRKNFESQIPGTLAQGSYVMQIYFDTWAWTKEDGEKTQKKFEKIGTVLIDSLKSEPVQLQIKVPERDCSKNKQMSNRTSSVIPMEFDN